MLLLCYCRVLALEAEDASIEAAGKVATEALTAAQSVVNGATDLVKWSLDALDDAFSGDSVSVSAWCRMRGAAASSPVPLLTVC